MTALYKILYFKEIFDDNPNLRNNTHESIGIFERNLIKNMIVPQIYAIESSLFTKTS